MSSVSRVLLTDVNIITENFIDHYLKWQGAEYAKNRQFILILGNLNSSFRKPLDLIVTWVGGSPVHRYYTGDVNNDSLGVVGYTSIPKPEGDTKYKVFAITEDCKLYGWKQVEGYPSGWTHLKLKPFLMKRGASEVSVLDLLSNKIPQYLSEIKQYIFTIKDLVEGYNQTPINSCMQQNGDYFAYLEEDNIGKLLEVEGATRGRAILWNGENMIGLPKGCKGFIDRVYPVGDEFLWNAYRRYAQENMYAIKDYNDGESYIYSDGSEYIREYNNFLIKVDNEITSYRMPYMDTYPYLYKLTQSTVFIETRETVSKGFYLGRSWSGIYTRGNLYEIAEFCHTDGRSVEESESLTCCSDCGDEIDLDEAYIVEGGDYVCEYCASDNYTWCEYGMEYSRNPIEIANTYEYATESYIEGNSEEFVEVNGTMYDLNHQDTFDYITQLSNGIWYELDEVRFVESLDEYHHIEDCVYSGHLDEWLLMDSDVVFLIDENDYITKDLAVYSKEYNYYLLPDNAYYSELDDDYYPESDVRLVSIKGRGMTLYPERHKRGRGRPRKVS